MSSQETPYDALVVVSPACLTGETKNQDRASWTPSLAIACVSDGVSTSPFAAQGAVLVVDSAPALFLDEHGPQAPIRVISDLLVARRLEAKRSPLKVAPGTSSALAKMLEDAARDVLEHSFQATLIAASFLRADDTTVANVVCVGDSAFFAFSPDGELLRSSLGADRQGAAPDALAVTGGMRFGPGDELLCKILGDASAMPNLAADAGIRPGSAGRWLVCLPIDRCQAPATPTHTDPKPKALPICSLHPGEPFLVPRYMVDMVRDAALPGYCRVRYSTSVRFAGAAPKATVLTFDEKGSATAVLPDHFYTGQWTHFRESFPDDTHFILCSDGFYTAFADPQDVWGWLRQNRNRLHSDTERPGLMEALHRQLHSRHSDDDMSFVWVYPEKDPPAAGESAEPGKREE